MNALTVVFAALCIFAIGYRFYGLFIANKVLNLNAARVTPAVKYSDGHDYVDTNKYVLFGHHFAAIAAAGPLLGPVLAAQFGYMPGLLWILIGCVLAGGVHDMVVLFASVRHRGQSLAYIASQEIDKTTGSVAAWAVLAILLLTLAGLSIAVVNAMHNSLWSTYTVAATIPIAIIMGLYMQIWRKGDVLGASIIGVVLLALCILTGPYVAAHPETFGWLDIDKKPMSILIPVYGFAASVLPVWMLLLPRDYLSTFLKIGTIGALALGIVFVMPDFNMPAFTEFTKGGGPIVGGPVIPFIFITIACGAISGFHSLVASGTTSKQIDKEGQAQPIGYGSMLIECLLAIISLCAVGFVWAQYKSGGYASPTQVFADGLSQMLAAIPGLANTQEIAYALLILAVSVFCLTSLDTATRLARYMFQEFWVPEGIKRKEDLPGYAKVLANPWVATIITVVLGVALGLTGYTLIWPLFGAANQLLAALALLTVCAWLGNAGKNNKMFYVPMVFMLAVTLTSLCITIYQKVLAIAAGTALFASVLQLVIGVLLIVLAIVLAVKGAKTLIRLHKEKKEPAAQ